MLIHMHVDVELKWDVVVEEFFVYVGTAVDLRTISDQILTCSGKK